MSADCEHDTIVNSMNQKEQELSSKIIFYKNNIEQLIRIKALEEELETLIGQVDVEYGKRRESERQERIKLQRIEYCKDNCKKAFEMLAYQNKHNEMLNPKYRPLNGIDIPVIVSGYLSQGQFKFEYIFDKINNTSDYNVKCIINKDVRNIILGTFNESRGFTLE
jgi:hypothetical protein